MMKQVGEAVRDFSLSGSFCDGEVVTIGIATWGALHNRESLIHPMVSWRLLLGREGVVVAQQGGGMVGS